MLTLNNKMTEDLCLYFHIPILTHPWTNDDRTMCMQNKRYSQ